MRDGPSSYRDHFFNALSSALEFLGPSKETVFRYLEANHAISFREGKLPSVEQVEDALRDIFGSAADAMIYTLRKRLNSDSMKIVWPSSVPVFAYAGCMFGCAGFVCCEMIQLCKSIMVNSM